MMNRCLLTLLGAALLMGGAGRAGAQEASGWIGISWGAEVRLNPARAQDVTLFVRNVHPESPAARAGVLTGDTILRVNGKSATGEILGELNRAVSPGEKVRLRLGRGRTRDITVTAATRPAAPVVVDARGNLIVMSDEMMRRRVRSFMETAVRVTEPGARDEVLRRDTVVTYRRLLPSTRDTVPPAPDRRVWGSFERTLAPGEVARARMPQIFHSRVQTEGDGPAGFRILEMIQMGNSAIAGAQMTTLDPALAEYFKARSGVLVTHVLQGTPADRAGLRPGDVVSAVNGRAVDNVAELRSAIATARARVTLSVTRKDAQLQVRLIDE